MKIPRKLSLANIPTPIQKLEYNKCKFLIKRDDYTGLELSGNKIRKLEYLLYDAKSKNCDYVFTCGGDQSNHCRATVYACNRLGLKSKIYLWGRQSKKYSGNLLLNKLAGAETRFLKLSDYKNVDDLMQSDALKLQSAGKKVYIVPTGGSNPLGIWGYINFVEELKSQISSKEFNGICCANGSGGTIAGILLGMALSGINSKVFGVNVFGRAEEMKVKIIEIVEECIKNYNLHVNVNFSNLELLDGYSEEGYKNISMDKIELIKDFVQNAGIMLDNTYTGKAFFAYNENFLKGKTKSNILFLHTGGLFGIFAKAEKFLSH
ncbi:MAG: pyridoxal-phosphate dependent enzyme [Bacteroidetes bacterium]|nr:pyridoxal-phosphate dependent enzyme [Bacteroidota bacterium]